MQNHFELFQLPAQFHVDMDALQEKDPIIITQN